MPRFSPFPTEIDDSDPAAIARLLRQDAPEEDAEVIPVAGLPPILRPGMMKIPPMVRSGKTAAEKEIEALLGDAAKDIPAKMENTTRGLHASQHKFDKFDTTGARGGTGEGSQVEATGTYFGEAKGVNDVYHDILTPKAPFRFHGEPVTPQQMPEAGLLEDYIRHHLRPGDTVEDLVNHVLPHKRQQENWYRTGAGNRNGTVYPKLPEVADEIAAAIKGLEGLDLKAWDVPKAWRYLADIKGPKESMIDLDKPYKMQPHIMEALPAEQRVPIQNRLEARQRVEDRKVRGTPHEPLQETGRDVYELLGSHLADRSRDYSRGVVGGPEASELLQKRGVPGAVFKDRLSRDRMSEWEMDEKLNVAREKLNAARTRPELDNATRDVLFWEKMARDAETQRPITQNIVSFPGTDIDILKRWGLAGTVGPGGAALLAEQLRRMDDEQYR